MKEDKNELFIYELPIQGRLHVVNFDERIGEPDQYREFYKLLLDASFGDYINLAINTNGGNLMTTVQIHNALKATRAQTRAVVYTAYSAGSIIAFSCDEIVVADHGSMMIHAAAWGTDGKVDELFGQSEHFKKTVSNMFHEVYKGFLTKGEINKVLENKDMWFDKEEIEKRLKRWKPIRSKAPK